MWICSPTFQRYDGGKTPLGVIREMHVEWKAIEADIIKKGMVGWITDTEYDNWPMMRFIHTAGAKPFDLAIKRKTVWFRKILKKEN